MNTKALFQELKTLYDLGVTFNKKKVELTQREVEEAEVIFCNMINSRPASLLHGLNDPAFSHKLLSLATCKNERRVSQLMIAFGNAISKKTRAEKGAIAIAALKAMKSFPHLSEHPGVVKMVNHLMMRSNERLAA